MEFFFLKAQKEIDVSGLYTYFYQEHNKTFRTAGEKHNFWELVYVDGGELSAVADNVGYALTQGDVIFHKPMEFHIHAAGGIPNNIMVVSFETQSPAMNFFANKIFSLNIKQKKILADFLEHMKELFGLSFSCTKINEVAFSSEQYASYQIAVALLERFLLELMLQDTYTRRIDKQSPGAKKNAETAFADAIRDYLAENIHRPLSLDDICSHFNMSKSYICQLFKNETGRSIIDYFIDLKISAAKFMIREGKLNFTQISEKLGYSGLHHFTRIFKKKVHLSPGQYEKSVN